MNNTLPDPADSTRVPIAAIDDPRLSFTALGLLAQIEFVRQAGEPLHTVADYSRGGYHQAATAIALLHETGHLPQDVTPAALGFRRLKLVELVGPACVWCGTADDLQVDHIVPKSRGGRDHVDNLRTLCGPCNRFKLDRLDDEVPAGEMIAHLAERG